MKIGAIICEYNPLHNGHVYHIRQTKKQGVTHLIAVLSDNFVQRGDVALFNKFDRAKLALRAGVDLVLELPVIYSCAAAQIYAESAVALLSRLGIVDVLSFGSSNGNLETLQKLADASAAVTSQHYAQVQDCMRSGHSYPSAVWEVLKYTYGESLAKLLQDPNNLLAVEYLKAIHKYQSALQPLTICRKCIMHDSFESQQHFASASFIRNSFLEGDKAYLDFVPAFTAKLLNERMMTGSTASMKRLERVIVYKMRTISEKELVSLPDMTPALAKRFLAARNAGSLDTFLAQVKTKCFTMSRIRRIILCAMIGIHREDTHMQQPYVRILAFNEKGREVLSIAKHTSQIEIGTSLTKLQGSSPQAAKLVDIEERAAQVYGLAQQNIHSAEQEFCAKIMMEAL